MKSKEIRSTFLNYFKKQDHLVLPSSSLIPADDPTLLFNNAGMNQFKGVFLGTEKPKKPRATTSQKCVRAGGKHNDLDNVGFTARHHTFFEMLGNFSFGDYFKEEAISYAWELLTKDFGLDPKKLYVTTFTTDEEARTIWFNKIGVPKDHHFAFGAKDNFWSMGDTGPCGPCSEIFYDFGPEMGDGPENVVGGNGDRFIEIWNLVFMQFNDDGTKQTALPNPSIDTGMGLERISMVLQNKKSNYETDVFMPLIDLASKLTQTPYDINDPKKKIQTAGLRVLADHARAVSFLIADGVLPSNEGRGYVLRRILRRAVRFNHKLNPTSPVFAKLCMQVIKQMGDVYPELENRKTIINDNVLDEENKFLETLDKGEALLEKELESLTSTGQKILSGKSAFKLYDTYGFPVDLTKIILNEKGFSLNESDFEKELLAAKNKAKAGGKKGEIQFNFPDSLKETFMNLPQTKFLGYESSTAKGKVLELHTQDQGLINKVSSGNFYLISDQTPFYAESGGQVGDTGFINSPSGKAKVLDVKKIAPIFVHYCELVSGEINSNDSIELAVNTSDREKIKKNHSATHLLHAALKKVCGASVQQAGSLVDSEKLRFDFTHKGPVSKTDLKKIEDLVNTEIQRAQETTTELMNLNEAKSAGAEALFGEKYDDTVRVVTMGGFSKELCGGTHVKNTGDIFAFKIVNETGVSSGIRRIEAYTGQKAFGYLNTIATEYVKVASELGFNINSKGEDILNMVAKLNEEIKNLKQKIKDGLSAPPTPTMEIDSKFGKIKASIFYFENLERDELKHAADQVRSKMKTPGICIFAGKGSDKGYPILVSTTADLKDLNAGSFLKELTHKLGGKGGGRPDFAQGSIDSVEDLKTLCLNLLS